jgi:FixJ family two-component response regulator
MPKLSGLDVMARLPRSGQRIPVVIITGGDAPASTRQATEAGADAVLSKPVNCQALLDAVAAATAHGSA